MYEILSEVPPPIVLNFIDSFHFKLFADILTTQHKVLLIYQRHYRSSFLLRPPANNQMEQDIHQIQQDIRQMRQDLQLLIARSANGSYDHARGDNIQWPPALAVAAGQAARQLPQHLPATWTEVTKTGERQLGVILRAYNLAPGPTMEAKLKQIRRYIGLRLLGINVND